MRAIYPPKINIYPNRYGQPLSVEIKARLTESRIPPGGGTRTTLHSAYISTSFTAIARISPAHWPPDIITPIYVYIRSHFARLIPDCVSRLGDNNIRRCEGISVYEYLLPLMNDCGRYHLN